MPFQKTVIKVLPGLKNDQTHLQINFIEKVLKYDFYNEVWNLNDCEISYF